MGGTIQVRVRVRVGSLCSVAMLPLGDLVWHVSKFGKHWISNTTTKLSSAATALRGSFLGFKHNFVYLWVALWADLCASIASKYLSQPFSSESTYLRAVKYRLCQRLLKGLSQHT
ncbi:unnamed protein product, partial [Discosporangium mesarthrocarpum]